MPLCRWRCCRTQPYHAMPRVVCTSPTPSRCPFCINTSQTFLPVCAVCLNFGTFQVCYQRCCLFQEVQGLSFHVFFPQGHLPSIRQLDHQGGISHRAVCPVHGQPGIFPYWHLLNTQPQASLTRPAACYCLACCAESCGSCASTASLAGQQFDKASTYILCSYKLVFCALLCPSLAAHLGCIAGVPKSRPTRCLLVVVYVSSLVAKQSLCRKGCPRGCKLAEQNLKGCTCLSAMLAGPFAWLSLLNSCCAQLNAACTQAIGPHPVLFVWWHFAQPAPSLFFEHMY